MIKKYSLILLLIFTLLVPVITFGMQPENLQDFETGGVQDYQEEGFQNYEEAYAKAIVLSVVEEELDRDLGAGIIENYQRVMIEITSGEFKGKTPIIENNYISSPGFEMHVSEGDRILLTVLYDQEGFQTAHIVDFVRDRYIFILGFIFLALMVAIGRIKGVKSVISLVVTFLVIYKVMIPQIFNGYNPVLISVISSVIIALLTFLIISGFSKKMVAAFLGTTAGLIIAALLAMIVSNAANLTGFGSEEAKMLYYFPQFSDANLKGVLLAGIILGALGAVMDVCMSIASSIEEVSAAGEEKSFKALFTSGMNVGNDIMGTMTNTLVLAYTGASLPLLLLLMANDLSFLQVMNFEMLADEIIRALVGTIGLVIAIPITAVISSVLLRKKA